MKISKLCKSKKDNLLHVSSILTISTFQKSARIKRAIFVMWRWKSKLLCFCVRIESRSILRSNARRGQECFVFLTEFPSKILSNSWPIPPISFFETTKIYSWPKVVIHGSTISLISPHQKYLVIWTDSPISFFVTDKKTDLWPIPPISPFLKTTYYSWFLFYTTRQPPAIIMSKHNKHRHQFYSNLLH